MKNRSLFFVAIMSLFITVFFTSCSIKSQEKLISDLQIEKQALAEANDKKDIFIADQQEKIYELEDKINNPVKISTQNFNYYEFYGSGQNKFYKIISLVVISDPVIIDGADGDVGGQTIEFILESIEPEPIRIIGSETYYYDKGGNSTIPAKIKEGNEVTFRDFYGIQEGG